MATIYCTSPETTISTSYLNPAACRLDRFMPSSYNLCYRQDTSTHMTRFSWASSGNNFQAYQYVIQPSDLLRSPTMVRYSLFSKGAIKLISPETSIQGLTFTRTSQASPPHQSCFLPTPKRDGNRNLSTSRVPPTDIHCLTPAVLFRRLASSFSLCAAQTASRRISGSLRFQL